MLDRINKELRQFGFALHWLRKRSKVPLVGEEWTTRKVATLAALERTYKEGQNIGVRLGDPSLTDKGYLYVIDVDIRDPECEAEAFKKLHTLFPDVDFDVLPCVKSGSGGPSVHYYILVDKAFPGGKLYVDKRKITVKTSEGKKEKAVFGIDFLGTGQQVVLPPSIHPDTGKPYVWLNEFDAESDDMILDPETIREAFELAGRPIRDKTKSDEPSEYNPLGVDIEDIADMIDELDLDKWCDGDRDNWLRLGMAIHHETGGSDEGFELWETYSSKSDLYNPKHIARDWKSFSLNPRDDPYTIRSIRKEVNDNRDRALYARFPDLFDDIDSDDRASKEGDGVRADPPRKGVQREFDDIEYDDGQPLAPGVPRFVQRMPGVLGQFAKWMNEIAVQDQPQLSVGAAIFLGSIALMRYYKTNYDNFANLYVLGVVETSSGKDNISVAVQKALNAAGKHDELLGPGDFTSDSALEGELEMRGRMGSIIDEVGHFFGAIKGLNGGAKATIEGTLLKLFSSGDKDYYPKGMSNMNKTIEQRRELETRKISNPGFSFIGMTTPRKFAEAITNADVGTGLMNRMLPIFSNLKLQYRNYHEGTPPPPKAVVKWLKEFSKIESDEDDMLSEKVKDTRFTPIIKEVHFTKGAIARVRELDRSIVDRMRETEETGLHSLYGRTMEQAMRLSLIVAMSDRSPMIEVEHFDWAYRFVRYAHDTMFEQFETEVGKGENARIAEKLVALIEAAGKKGIAYSKLLARCAEFRNLDKDQQRQEVITRLKTDFGIFPQEGKKNSKTGEPGLKFYAPGFEPRD